MEGDNAIGLFDERRKRVRGSEMDDDRPTPSCLVAFLSSRNRLDSVELLERLLDDLNGLVKVLLRDNERGCQPDNVDVRRFGKQSLGLEQQAQVPCAAAFRALGLINHDRVQQTLAAHFLDPPSAGADSFEGLETFAHVATKSVGSVRQLFLLDDLQCGGSDSASERVATIRGTVLPWQNLQQNVPR